MLYLRILFTEVFTSQMEAPWGQEFVSVYLLQYLQHAEDYLHIVGTW